MLINLQDDVKVLSYFSFACDIDILGFGCGRGDSISIYFIWEKRDLRMLFGSIFTLKCFCLGIWRKLF